MALVAVVALSGCVTPDWARKNDSTVVFRIVAINGGTPLRSDVLGAAGPVADTVPVVLAARSKNPNHNTAIYTRAVFVERYEVRFIRTDGRNTEGVDVPFRVTGALSTAVDIGEPSNNVTVLIEVVRQQAKLEPPLSTLRTVGPPPSSPSPPPQNGVNVGGGPQVITMFAEITVFGRVFSGEAVSDTGRVQIDFSDFPNG